MTERHHLHLESDSTGETTQGVVRACMAQFEGVEVSQHLWPMVRSGPELEVVLKAIRDNPGAVLFTLVNESTRAALQRECNLRHDRFARAVLVLDAGQQSVQINYRLFGAGSA